MSSQPISNVNLFLFGLLTWIIPFAASIPLIGKDGQPIVPQGVFKSLMIVIGSAVGAWLLVLVFRQRPTCRYPSLVVGLLWLAINIGFDLLILVPLTGMNLTDYAGEIALRYLAIPIMAIAISVASEESNSR